MVSYTLRLWLQQKNIFERRSSKRFLVLSKMFLFPAKYRITHMISYTTHDSV